MNQVSLNVRQPLNADQIAVRKNANAVKEKVKTTAANFQTLDNSPEVDMNPQDSMVQISPEKPGEMPLSFQEQMAERMAGGTKLERTKAAGMSQADENGQVTDAMIQTTKGDSQESFQYSKLEDGTEVFHGPTADGYAVIKENLTTGTLFMETSEQPMVEKFDALRSGAFQVPDAENKPSDEPQTFGSAMKSFAVNSADGSGSAQDYRARKLEAGKAVWGAVRNGFSSLFGGGDKKSA